MKLEVFQRILDLKSHFEFLALKWAVTNKFKDYLYGAKFTVRTDNNPLCYVLSTVRLDATGQRWVSELANFDFSLEYRSGRRNVDADFLSRIPQAQTPSPKDDKIITNDVVKAICTCQVPYFLGVLPNNASALPVTTRGSTMVSLDVREEQMKEALNEVADFRHPHNLCQKQHRYILLHLHCCLTPFG